MKFRDAQQMMEIARLKLQISEMREKEARLKAQLLMAHAGNPDGLKHQNDSGQQQFMKQRLAALDEQIRHMCNQIDTLQSLVDMLLDQVSEKNNIVKELALAKATIRHLQEEISDDAKVTKTKLMTVKQQLNDLERTDKLNMQKEKDYKNVSVALQNLESEVTGLKQGNNELLLQNEVLRQKIITAQQRAEKMGTHTMDSAMAEVSKLRSTNHDLTKMVEDLQSSRFNEIEELVYLRWVNACLRHDVDARKASHNETNNFSDLPSNGSHASQRSKDGYAINYTNLASGVKDFDKIRCHIQALADKSTGRNEYKSIAARKPASFNESQLRSSQKLSIRRNSSLDSRDLCPEIPTNQTQKKLHNDQRRFSMDSTEKGTRVTTKSSIKDKLQKRYSIWPGTIPMDNSEFSHMPSLDEHFDHETTGFDKDMCKSSPPSQDKEWSNSEISPLSLIRYESDYSINGNLPISVDQNKAYGKVANAFKILSKSGKMGSSVLAFKDLPRQHDYNEEILPKTGEQLLLEWYKSSRDDTSLQVAMSNALVKHPQTHKSSHQNDFIQDLAQSIRVTNYRCIEDVVAFIEWLDRQVDNEDFLSCKDWPTIRVDAMRWAVREFQKLKQLESEIGYFNHEFEAPPDLILKEMLIVQKKAEKYIGDFMQARDQIVEKLRILNLPTDWMFDSGIVAKVKLGTDLLFQKCVRKAEELQW